MVSEHSLNQNEIQIQLFFTVRDQTSSVISTTSNNLPPSIIVHHDNSAFPSSIVLDETNFPLWSQLMEMRIGGRNKIGYLIGENAKPITNDPNYVTWITENSRVKS